MSIVVACELGNEKKKHLREEKGADFSAPCARFVLELVFPDLVDVNIHGDVKRDSMNVWQPGYNHLIGHRPQRNPRYVLYAQHLDRLVQF